jgi:disulfide bond formation protein DsbB
MNLLLKIVSAFGSRTLWAAAAAACFGSVAMALVAQHRFDMQPCPWCILQRVIFLLIGAVAVLGAVSAGDTGRRSGIGPGMQIGLAGLNLLLALSGAAAALYQNLVAAATNSCDLSLADRIITGLHLDRWLPDVFEVRATCAEAAVSLLGVPFELWSLALFLLLGGLMALLALRAKD